jgi:hypothetical protein
VTGACGNFIFPDFTSNHSHFVDLSRKKQAFISQTPNSNNQVMQSIIAGNGGSVMTQVSTKSTGPDILNNLAN